MKKKRCDTNSRMKDGSVLHEAFKFQFRMYSIPEIREALEDAGFSNSKVYWSAKSKDAEDRGEHLFEEIYETVQTDTWTAMIVATY